MTDSTVGRWSFLLLCPLMLFSGKTGSVSVPKYRLTTPGSAGLLTHSAPSNPIACPPSPIIARSYYFVRVNVRCVTVKFHLSAACFCHIFHRRRNTEKRCRCRRCKRVDFLSLPGTKRTPTAHCVKRGSRRHRELTSATDEATHRVDLSSVSSVHLRSTMDDEYDG